MPSHHAQGLELLVRIKQQLNETKSDGREHQVAVLKRDAFRQTWDSLTTALIATAEVADNAVAASKHQRAKWQSYAHELTRIGRLRTRQANACLARFRYVTALSNHLRAVGGYHKSELVSLENLRRHYEQALGPQTDLVRNHQTFLDNLGRKIEAVERTQGLQIVCIRWIQLRAKAVLKEEARRFHLACKGVSRWERRAEKARRRAYRLQKIATRSVKDYGHLETEFLKVKKAIESL